MSSRETILTIRPDNVIIVKSEALKPDDIIELIKTARDGFKNPEAHIAAIQKGWDIQGRILEHGGTISTDGQIVHVNGDPKEDDFDGKKILPNMNRVLAYGFTKPKADRPSRQVFFRVENGNLTLFEIEQRWIEAVMGNKIKEYNLERPRFSTMSLTNVLLTHVANTQGKGRIR